jgi:hypothetical protein
VISSAGSEAKSNDFVRCFFAGDIGGPALLFVDFFGVDFFGVDLFGADFFCRCGFATDFFLGANGIAS